MNAGFTDTDSVLNIQRTIIARPGHFNQPVVLMILLMLL